VFGAVAAPLPRYAGVGKAPPAPLAACVSYREQRKATASGLRMAEPFTPKPHWVTRGNA
jgi:hypothetical protein